MNYLQNDIYLTVEEVLFIQEKIINQFSGIHGIRDINSLESSVARPQSGYYEDIIGEAAALMESLTKNHSFLDGNKRSAFFATDVFLRLNGYFIECSEEEANILFIKNLEENKFRFEIVKKWLKENTRIINAKN